MSLIGSTTHINYWRGRGIWLRSGEKLGCEHGAWNGALKAQQNQNEGISRYSLRNQTLFPQKSIQNLDMPHNHHQNRSKMDGRQNFSKNHQFGK